MPRGSKAPPADAWRNRIVGHAVKPAKDFLAHPLNWRIHPQLQQDALQGSLDELGWIDEVIENQRTGTVINGHLRISLALRQGDETLVPVKYVDLSPEEERTALASFDWITAMAMADREKLDELLQETKPSNERLQQMLADMADREGLYMGHGAGPLEDVAPQIDRAAELQEQWGTKLGQLWEVPSLTGSGKAHRLLCGDSAKLTDVQRLMYGLIAAMVLTDPPYNIGLDYATYDDRKSEEEYQRIITDSFRNAYSSVQQDGHAVLTLGHNWLWPTREWIQDAGWRFRHIGVWHNPQRYAGSHPGMWPFAWEGVLDFTKGGFRKLNNGNGVGYSDVWIESPSAETSHPAERPIAMWADILQLCTSRDEVVLDLFTGSGSTLLVSERYGRQGCGLEIDPKYIAVTIQRLADMGLKPSLVES